MVGDFVPVAGNFHGLVEQHRVGIGFNPAPFENRRQVGTTAEPVAGRDHHAGVHVNGRHVGVYRVGNQRNAGSPEPRVFVCTGDLLTELGRKLSVDRGCVDAYLFEDAAFHHRHDAATATAVACPFALDEAARIAIRERASQIVLQGFEGSTDDIPEVFEPGLGLFLLLFDTIRVSGRQLGFLHGHIVLSARLSKNSRFVFFKQFTVSGDLATQACRTCLPIHQKWDWSNPHSAPILFPEGRSIWLDYRHSRRSMD